MQCTSSNSTRVSLSSQPPVSYSVKLINEAKKSDYRVHKLSTSARFTTRNDIKQQLHAIDRKAKDTFGYIDPGHGLKGKQNVITSDQDLVEMYAAYKNKHGILLWCYFESDVSKQRKDQPQVQH